MASLWGGTARSEYRCSFPDPFDIYQAYGVNHQPRFDDVCAIYEASGFLYPQKSDTLTPFLPSIRQLWAQLMRTKPPLLMVGVDERHKRSTGAVWKGTSSTWFVQHLASQGDPFGTASLVMGTIAALYLPGEANGFQVWFRGDNKLPRRIFASGLLEGNGEDSALHTYHYCMVRKQECTTRQFAGLEVVSCDESTADLAGSLVGGVRGNAFVAVEELSTDPFLAAIDAQFRCEGLRRDRQIYVVCKGGQAVGCAHAFRGPLGLNFSFLENRCDLVIKPGLEASESAAIVEALLSSAIAAYADFEPEWIPVTTDAPSAGLPTFVRPVRSYTQAIYLRPAMPRFYDGLRGIYARLLARQVRLGTFDSSVIDKTRTEVVSPWPPM
jgi:hypothetical protein